MSFRDVPQRHQDELREVLEPTPRPEEEEGEARRRRRPRGGLQHLPKFILMSMWNIEKLWQSRKKRRECRNELFVMMLTPIYTAEDFASSCYCLQLRPLTGV